MKVFKEENYIVDKKDKKTAAILPIEKYAELIEDLHNLSVITERRDEPTITFDKIKEKWKIIKFIGRNLPKKIYYPSIKKSFPELSIT